MQKSNATWDELTSPELNQTLSTIVSAVQPHGVGSITSGVAWPPGRAVALLLS